MTALRPEVARWLLTASERDNPDTVLDDAHPGEQAWSTGNLVTPLVDGVDYFTRLHAVLEATTEGDFVLIVGWRVDGDEQLTDSPDSQVLAMLERAEDRGVRIRALFWRSHSEQVDFSAEKNREVAESLADEDDPHAEVLLDMRVRRGGAHHQKFVVVRHRGDTARDVAFVGGIDLAHSRRDDHLHHGDPQQEGISAAYGPRPGWHDVQVMIQGPAVADVETVFRERWQDPSPLTPALHSRIRDMLARVPHLAPRLPAPHPAPEPVEGGRAVVQLLRTYPHLHRRRAYPFAAAGERSIARAHRKALDQARGLVYIEDQYLWSDSIVSQFAASLRDNPDLRLIAVLPSVPDTEGFGGELQLEGRLEALRQLEDAAADRFAAYSLENHTGWPVYVHAKVCIIDDWYATVGSDNINRRSWTHDSELAALVIEDGGDHSPYARSLRLRLAAEHLDRPLSGPEHEAAMADCIPAEGMFETYAASAAALEAWHEAGGVGVRPPGRLRLLSAPELPTWRRRLLVLPQRLVGDPDGRPSRLRRRAEF